MASVACCRAQQTVYLPRMRAEKAQQQTTVTNIDLIKVNTVILSSVLLPERFALTKNANTFAFGAVRQSSSQTLNCSQSLQRLVQ